MEQRSTTEYKKVKEDINGTKKNIEEEEEPKKILILSIFFFFFLIALQIFSFFSLQKNTHLIFFFPVTKNRYSDGYSENFS